MRRSYCLGNGKKKPLDSAALILACGVIINLMVYYGVRTMDHHGLSRVEFKKAALWYRDNAGPSDKMLISETQRSQVLFRLRGR